MRNTLFLIVFVIACSSGGSASPATRPALSPVRSDVLAHAATRRIAVRGGGVFGTPVTKENLLSLYSGFYGLQGALGMPAPEATAKFGDFPRLVEGTASFVVYENLYAVALGYAIMVYLSAFSNKSAPQIVAYAGLPCAYVTYKNQLKGLFEKLGASNGQGIILTIFMLSCLYTILANKGNVEMIAKVFALPPVVIGTISEVDPDLGIKISGYGSALSGASKTFYMWYAALMTGWGALAQMLLQGMNPTKAIAYAALLETVFMIDCNYIRKWNVGVSPDSSNYVFLAIPALTAAGLLS